MAIKVEMMTRIATTLIPKKADAAAAAAAAAADDDDDVDETRSPGYGRYDDAWQLAPEVIFLIGSRCWFWRQFVSVGDIFGNDKIKFLSFLKS